MDSYQITTLQATMLGVLLVWDLVWRGLALWRAGGNRQKGWFIVLLILNTAGILPIFYLLTNKAEKRHND